MFPMGASLGPEMTNCTRVPSDAVCEESAYPPEHSQHSLFFMERERKILIN